MKRIRCGHLLNLAFLLVETCVDGCFGHCGRLGGIYRKKKTIQQPVSRTDTVNETQRVNSGTKTNHNFTTKTGMDEKSSCICRSGQTV